MLTNQQLLDRTEGIGGSDVAIILGLSDFKTPLELYLEKKGKVEIDTTQTPLQEWGHRLEPVIIEKFIENNNVTVSRPDTIVHPLYDFMRANVDGIINETNRILEVKCCNSFAASEWGEPGTDEVPLKYLVQGVHYVSCANVSGSDYAVLIGGYDYREYIYNRDSILERKIINACSDFMDCVKSGNEPEPVKISDLKLKYNPQPGKQILINEDLMVTIPQLSDIKQKKKELDELENEYKFEIAKYMADAECLVDGNGKPVATYKANKKGNRSLLLKGV